jgi:hypothetical protein
MAYILLDAFDGRYVTSRVMIQADGADLRRPVPFRCIAALPRYISQQYL